MLASALVALLPFLAIANAGPVTKRGTKQLIQSGTPGMCLTPEGGRDAVARGDIHDGTPVVVRDCSYAAPWDISPGSGSVVVSGTNFALDLGLNPSNNGAVYVWTSYPGAPQQTWYLTDDNRIAQTGGNQCLDLGPSGPQTYQCTTGNTNQVWNVRNGDFGTPSTSASASPSPSSTAAPGGSEPLSDVVVQNVYPNPSSGGLRVHPYNREDLCLTIKGGYAAIGTEVAIAGCFAESDNPDPRYPGGVQFQLWDPINEQGQIKYHYNQDLCLDAGSNPANGGEIKIWTCGDYPQQKWQKNGKMLQTANNQCLDVEKESGTDYRKPYTTSKEVQTWECSTNGDPYQVFFGL